MTTKGKTLDDLFRQRNRVIRVEDGQVVYHCLLMTTIRRMRYDFEQRVGVLYLPAGVCTDMSGAIQFFKKIDPEVHQIQTYSGEQRDTIYTRTGKQWEALRGPRNVEAPAG